MIPASKGQSPYRKHKYPSKYNFRKDVQDAVCNGLQTHSKLTVTTRAFTKRCICLTRCLGDMSTALCSAVRVEQVVYIYLGVLPTYTHLGGNVSKV